MTHKVVTRRADVSPHCYALPHNHMVSPNEGGWFDVKSGHSGKQYRVDTDGNCDCPAYAEWHHCSHQEAVLKYARRVLSIKNGGRT